MAKKPASAPVDETPQDDETESTLDSDLGDAIAADSDDSSTDDAAEGQSDSTVSTESEAASPPSLLDRLKAKGFDVEGDDDEAVLNSLYRQQQQAKSVAPYAGKLHEYINNAEQFASWKAQQQQWSQQQQVQQQQAQQQQEDWYKRPEWDNAWLKYVDQASGSLTPDTPPHLQEKILNFANWKARTQEQFWEHPGQFMRPELDRIKREAVAEAQHMFQQQQYQQQVQQAVGEISQKNPWMWQSSPDGTPIVNPVTNQPVFSDTGARVVNMARQIVAESQGQINQPRAMQLAIDSVFAGESRSYFSAQQAMNPAEKNQAAKDKLLKKNNNRMAGRGGSLNGHRTQEAEQNSHLSTHDRLMAEFDKAGITDAELMAH